MPRKKKRYTTVVEKQDAPDCLASYPKQIYRVDVGEYDREYTAAYSIGKITLCLYDPHNFILYAIKLQKNFDGGHAYTTSLERMIEGVELLNSCADWDQFDTFSKEEKERLFLLTDQVFTEYFGATFRWFDKGLAQALTGYMRAIDKINQTW